MLASPRFPPLGLITPWSVESLGVVLLGATASRMTDCVSTTSTANLAHFYPFEIYEPVLATKLAYRVGGTATGNADLGIYDAEWNELVSSGSTAQGSTNAIQEIDVTDTVLLPALYFMSIQFSSSSGTKFALTLADEFSAITPLFTQAVGSFGLPMTAAPTISGADPIVIAMAVYCNSLI